MNICSTEEHGPSRYQWDNGYFCVDIERRVKSAGSSATTATIKTGDNIYTTDVGHITFSGFTDVCASMLYTNNTSDMTGALNNDAPSDVTQELYTNMLYTCDISSIMCVLQLGQFIVIKQFQEWCISNQAVNYIEHLNVWLQINWSHLNCVDMNYIKHWTICQMAIMCVLKHGMDFFKQVRIVQQMCDINKFIKHGCSC